MSEQSDGGGGSSPVWNIDVEDRPTAAAGECALLFARITGCDRAVCSCRLEKGISEKSQASLEEKLVRLITTMNYKNPSDKNLVII